ncbi:signal peptide peptidase SppA [Flavobacterium sp. NST-5]|uniref:Signal peptide peptidase SppA n=1 Tax=Flavobacterium ichthyis TaxID=2698827 RepID=A0ABW9Z4W1_9FLAO|nr:signal peptide peptidase SppA [Flavobacterium ichthyis]NBL63674.1 signal peptide peptidase SppA [Flavobacterium ichthyis]
MNFLKNVLATILGLFIFCFLMFFLMIIFAALAGNSNSKEVIVKNDSVIELDLAMVTNDYGGKVKYEDFTFLNEERHDGFIDVLNAIEAAKEDDKIKGISILNNNSFLGIAQSKSLRDKLNDFKKSGKFVVAYSNVISQKDYYVNSVADTIYLNPVGEMDFKGLSSEVMFFKDFQEKTGIKMEVIRHGKYKSAVEPYLANEMSDANREQISALLNSIWGSMVTDISKSRNVSVERLNEIADNLLARTPEMAKSEKLIDKIAYEDEYHNGIRKALKVDKDKDYNTVSILDYAEKTATSGKKSSENTIAVIYAQGTILGGEGDVNIIGEGSMRRAIEEARTNKKIKAIVLRIDSPGGSALTSELIWREIEITKKTKPVIVSMGNVAASGGYYIACNANEIFAEPNTITGSIGVFGTLPNLTKITNDIGIHTEQVNTHKNAAGYSVFMPLDETTKMTIQESVENIYKTFVTRVATGRKMTFAQVDSIAQGRVWTGVDAQKIGLVDKLGGLDQAIAAAAKKANLKDYKTKNFPEYEKNFGDFFGGMPFMQTREEFIKEEVGEENYRMIEQIRRMSAQKGIQALMPFEININ